MNSKIPFSIKVTSVLRWLGVALSTFFLYWISLILAVLDRSGRLSHLFHHRFWSPLVLLSVGANIVVHGTENIDRKKNYIIACNHEGSVEIPILIRHLPLLLSFAAKRSLFSIPFFGWAMGHARHVPIDRGQGQENARLTLAHLSQRFQKGFSVLMFPEGTRSRTGEIGPFRSGTFRLALQTHAEILPVAIYGSYRGQPDHDWVIHPGRILINIGAPISTPAASATLNPEAALENLKNQCRDKIIALHRQAEEMDGAIEKSPASPVAATQFEIPVNHS